MARRAKPKTKGHTPRQKINAVAKDIAANGPRRGRSKPRDVEPPEPLLADVPALGGDEAAPDASPQPEMTIAATDDVGAEATPAPKRRGRRPKAAPVPDAPAEPEDAAVDVSPSEAAADGAEPSDPASAKPRRGRPRKAEATATDQPDDAVPANAPAADPAQGEAPVRAQQEPSAARWNPATGTASFDWPTIEQVAATEGPNQAMARLLLAARAEGANSRWPF